MTDVILYKDDFIMKQFEIQLSEVMKNIIMDSRNRLNYRIKAVYSELSKKGGLGSGARIIQISDECIKHINELAKKILELSKVEIQRFGSLDRNEFNKSIVRILNPEKEYAKHIIIDTIINIQGEKPLDHILNTLNYDGRITVIIQDTLLEFDKYIIEIEKINSSNKREKDNLFWSKIGVIALIASILVTILLAILRR